MSRSGGRWPITSVSCERASVFRSLSEVGVPEEGIPQLAEDAMGEGSTLVNPRETSEDEFAELFRQAL